MRLPDRPRRRAAAVALRPVPPIVSEALEARRMLAGQAPTIEMVAGPYNAVQPGELVGLVCWWVTDPEGDAVTVRFYLEDNGVPGLQELPVSNGAAADTLVDTDADGTDDYIGVVEAPSDLAVTAGYTYYAVVDDGLSRSDVVSTEVWVSKPLTSVTPAAAYAGDTVTLEVVGMTVEIDPELGRHPPLAGSVRFYQEANGEEGFQRGRELFVGHGEAANPGELPPRFTLEFRAEGQSAETRTYYASDADFDSVLTLTHAFAGPAAAKPDRFENNDDFASAAPLEFPTEYWDEPQLTLDAPGDADFFGGVAGEGGRHVQVALHWAQYPTDTSVVLYDGERNMLAQWPEAVGEPNDLRMASAWVPQGEAYFVKVFSPGGQGPSFYGLSVHCGPAQVNDRRGAYKNSALDGYDATPGVVDVAAMAADRISWVPGSGPITSVYFTTYDKGTNAIALNVWGLPPGSGPGGAESLSASDFEFRVGTGGDPATWRAAPAPNGVGVERATGPFGQHRVAVTWPDGAILNTWLQVTLKATGHTGLAAPDVSYFGNLAGDTVGGAPGRATQGTVFRVDGQDLAAMRRNVGAVVGDGTIAYDHNRDGVVNLLDAAVTRRNLARTLSGFDGDPTPLEPALIAHAATTPRRARASLRGELFAEAPILT